MYLFSRTARISQGGDLEAKLGHAVQLTQRVSEVSGLEVGLYAHQFSAGLGTIVWTAFVPDLATLEAAGDRMTASADLQGFIASGSDSFADGIDDALFEILHGVPEREREINYVSGIASAIAPGKLQSGVTLGTTLAEKSSAISGQDCLFVIGVTGVFGAVGWLTGYADLPSLQAGQHAIFSDPGMLDLIDGEAATTFPPLATTSNIYRRIV
jgi:hypothetical protein